MKTLFLTHSSHESGYNVNFAKAINAEIKILPFESLSMAAKKYRGLEYFLPLISLVYSFFIKADYDILVVDGGTSLYTAVFLKMRNNKLKIISHNADLQFVNLKKRGLLTKKIMSIFLKKIDGIISDSEENEKYTQFLNVPKEICYPHPQEVKRDKQKKSNYGLYVGRLDPDKNIKRIVNFGIQCPYFEKFIVAGDGALKDYVEEKARRHKKLVYPGKIKDVGRLYNKCKFLIHIPDYEPYGCTIMESTICGCFPIISRGVGAKDLLDDLFIINNPDDFNEINERIKYILENEKKAGKILEKSIPKIPSKEECIENFKIKFQKIMSQMEKQK